MILADKGTKQGGYPRSCAAPWSAGSLVLGTLLALFVPAARADELRAHLDWDRPIATMCPAATTLQADVEQLVGRSVFAAREQADVLVRGVVEDDESGVLVRLDARDRRGNMLGSRELTAPPGECASLRRALGLVLAFLLEQDSLLREPERGLLVPSSLGAFVGLLSSGTVPRADLGVGVALALDAARPVRVRIDASYWLPVILATPRGVGARFQAALGGLSVCPRVLSGPVLRIWLCAGARLGALISQPLMLNGLDHQARLLVQPDLEVAIAVRVGRHASLQATLGGLLNVLRPTFTYGRGDGDTVPAHRPELFGAILSAGLTID